MTLGVVRRRRRLHRPPSNVLAYTAALFTSGVRVYERTTFTGLAAGREL